MNAGPRRARNKTVTSTGFLRERGGGRAANTYPAELVGALHAAHLDVSILSSGDDLHTVEVAGQDHHVAAGAVGLEGRTRGEGQSDPVVNVNTTS